MAHELKLPYEGPVPDAEIQEATFIRSLEINDPKIVEEVLHPLSSKGQLKALSEWIEEASRKEVVEEYVVNPTINLVNEHGVFGLPYFIVQKDKDSSPRYFFGSDRLEHMAYYLQLPYDTIIRAQPREQTPNL
ncbi:hypothetical protein L0F63_006030 [Massospora cicadina]|nr:hypothetical protein L0F63_006030 [Massospora cicadina]